MLLLLPSREYWTLFQIENLIRDVRVSASEQKGKIAPGEAYRVVETKNLDKRERYLQILEECLLFLHFLSKRKKIEQEKDMFGLAFRHM